MGRPSETCHIDHFILEITQYPKLFFADVIVIHPILTFTITRNIYGRISFHGGFSGLGCEASPVSCIANPGRLLQTTGINTGMDIDASLSIRLHGDCKMSLKYSLGYIVYIMVYVRVSAYEEGEYMKWCVCLSFGLMNVFYFKFPSLIVR